MKTVAGAILFLAAAVALAGGLIAEAIGKSNYGFGTLGILAAVVMGGLGFVALAAGLVTDRRN